MTTSPINEKKLNNFQNGRELPKISENHLYIEIEKCVQIKKQKHQSHNM